MTDQERQRSTRSEVEPLLSALETAGDRPKRSRLVWKLLWATIVFLALLGIVLNQAF